MGRSRRGISTAVSSLLLIALMASFVVPFVHLYFERLRRLELEAEIDLAIEVIRELCERGEASFSFRYGKLTVGELEFGEIVLEELKSIELSRKTICYEAGFGYFHLLTLIDGPYLPTGDEPFSLFGKPLGERAVVFVEPKVLVDVQNNSIRIAVVEIVFEREIALREGSLVFERLPSEIVMSVEELVAEGREFEVVVRRGARESVYAVPVRGGLLSILVERIPYLVERA